MQSRRFGRCALLAIPLLLFSLASAAEIYKWVDAEGRTHYSERKDAAGGRALVVDGGKSTPATSAPVAGSTEYWQDQERQFRQRQLDKTSSKGPAPVPAAPPKSLSGGRSDGSDSSRCNLARDVLSGAVRHGNGTATDQYDLEVARNDVRAFCH